MRTFRALFDRFFGSLPGLLVVVVVWDALLVATLAPFSGPLRPLGLAGLLNLDLGDADRVGRIIMLYHSLAIPFVAAVVYLILDQVPLGMPRPEFAAANQTGFPRPAVEQTRRAIVVPVTLGYMLTSLGGMTFAYGGRNWVFHGIYLVGLSLVFYAGVLLAVALWPWRARTPAPARGGHPAPTALERLTWFVVVLFVLVSAGIGGTAGAFFGNGFEAFLAEDIVRVDPHSTFELMIIAHLHIMLTLIDVAILLLVIRFYNVTGSIRRIALSLTLVGTVVVTFATWSVIGWEGAHRLINVGSAFLLPGAVLVAVWGFACLMRREEAMSAGRGAKFRALLRDPLPFGVFFELIFVNVVVSGPGVYVAFNLERYRSPAYLEVERTILVGHWHILATLSAVVVLLLIADRLAIQGWARQLAGWGLLVGSTLSFLFVNLYMFRQPDQEQAWTVPFFEAGVALSLLAVALLAAVAIADRARPEAGSGRP